MRRSILIVGHPRCGSGYMSKLVSCFGLDVGHEKGTCVDGISNWAFAVEHEPELKGIPEWARGGCDWRESFVDFDFCIHHLRNPIDALPSICVNEICFVNDKPADQWEFKSSFLFRQAYIYRWLGKAIDLAMNLLEVAIQSFLYWNEVIELQQPDLVVRVEDGESLVREFLMDKGLIHDPPEGLYDNKKYNSRGNSRYDLSLSNYASVRPKLLRDLHTFCVRYGYPNFFEQIQSLGRPPSSLNV